MKFGGNRNENEATVIFFIYSEQKNEQSNEDVSDRAIPGG